MESLGYLAVIGGAALCLLAWRRRGMQPPFQKAHLSRLRPIEQTSAAQLFIEGIIVLALGIIGLWLRKPN